MYITCLVITTSLILCSATWSAAWAQPAKGSKKKPSGERKRKRFVQDRFVVGMFGDPPLTDERYKEIADANFTLAVGNMHADTPENVRKQIALCRKHGLQTLVICRELPPEEYPEGEACCEYVIWDKPGAALFSELAKIAKALSRIRRGPLPVASLLGRYPHSVSERLEAVC